VSLFGLQPADLDAALAELQAYLTQSAVATA
jgi:hypothetical protein